MSPENATSAAKPALRWVWACALVVCIFVASGQSQVAAPNIIDFDKFAHFSVFGLLATLVARALGGSDRRRWWAILIVSAYGACDEIRQSFTPGRSVEVDDWIADTLGAAVAVTLYQLWPAYRALLERKIFQRRLRTDMQPAAIAKPAPTAEAPADCPLSQ